MEPASLGGERSFGIAARKIDGKRLQISLLTDDEKIAIQRVSQIKTSGALTVTETFDDNIRQFIAAKQSVERHTERSTKWFEETLKQFSKYIQNEPAHKVTEADVVGFYNDLRNRVAETTAKSYMGAVRSFFSWTIGALGLSFSSTFIRFIPATHPLARDALCLPKFHGMNLATA